MSVAAGTATSGIVGGVITLVVACFSGFIISKSKKKTVSENVMNQ